MHFQLSRHRALLSCLMSQRSSMTSIGISYALKRPMLYYGTWRVCICAKRSTPRYLDCSILIQAVNIQASRAGVTARKCCDVCSWPGNEKRIHFQSCLNARTLNSREDDVIPSSILQTGKLDVAGQAIGGRSKLCWAHHDTHRLCQQKLILHLMPLSGLHSTIQQM